MIIMFVDFVYLNLEMPQKGIPPNSLYTIAFT